MTPARRVPWPLVVPLAALLTLAWPPDDGRGLGVKAINWLADPSGQLPRRPEPLAIGLDDDADVVTAHDQEEHAYEALYQRSGTMRARLRLRDFRDPLEPGTERPVLVAIGAIVALWAFTRRTENRT